MKDIEELERDVDDARVIKARCARIKGFDDVHHNRWIQSKRRWLVARKALRDRVAWDADTPRRTYIEENMVQYLARLVEEQAALHRRRRYAAKYLGEEFDSRG